MINTIIGGSDNNTDDLTSNTGDYLLAHEQFLDENTICSEHETANSNSNRNEKSLRVVVSPNSSDSTLQSIVRANRTLGFCNLPNFRPIIHKQNSYTNIIVDIPVYELRSNFMKIHLLGRKILQCGRCEYLSIGKILY